MPSLLRVGRPHWLNRSRVRAYAKTTLVLYLLVAGAFVLYRWKSADPGKLFIASDLAVFWIAGGFACAGHAALAYDPIRIQAAMAQWAPQIQGGYGWFYPPTFLVAVLPMGYLSYAAAYLSFMTATGAGYFWVVRTLAPEAPAGWALAAFPGLWINVLTGQNGLLTATLAAAALQAYERRPLVAGLVAGLLVIKPHLALLFPVAMLAARSWQAFLGAAISAGALVGLGTAVLGSDTWAAWQHGLGTARALMEAGGTAPMMPTAFSFLRLLQAPVSAAYAAQAASTLAAIAAVWRVWQSEAPFALKAATLMTASLLATPYLFEYDLAWLGPALAWAAPVAQRQGWRRGEREIFLAAWALPILAVLVAVLVRVQVGPWVVAALLAMLVTRALEGKGGR